MLCVSDLVRAVFRYVQALKRPGNIMASWLRVATQSFTVRPPFSKLRIARKISFVAASSVGNEPLVLSVLRNTRFNDSTAFVV